jgi:hypothetical protein
VPVHFSGMTVRGHAVILKLNLSKSCDQKKKKLLGHNVRNSNVHPVYIYGPAFTKNTVRPSKSASVATRCLLIMASLLLVALFTQWPVHFVRIRKTANISLARPEIIDQNHIY